MDEVANQIQRDLLKLNGIGVYYDGSKSIGRRYARADEIGVPWAITVDHTTIEDGTVTIRRRDDQLQIRISQDDLAQHLQNGTLGSLY
jgi:glycyl-tRNA synthetase